MKIAVLSDIHGNIDALKRVILELEKEKITKLFLLGDQLGYYYDAQAVYKLIEGYDVEMISGNHERIFLDYLMNEDSSVDEKYGFCFKYYKNTFPDDLIDEIKNLPDELRVNIDGITFGLFHGSSFNKDAYIYPTEPRDILNKFSHEKSEVIFIGHSHYPFVFHCEGKLIVNVGSVGQSRVQGGIAQWGVYDTSNQVYIPRSTSFDVKEVIKKINKSDKGKYLEKILYRNNIHI